MYQRQKGFTLLELLIVIAILAVLSSVTLIVLNPAELLRKSRDAQRISDLSTMKTAIGYYIVSTSSPVLGNVSGTGNCIDQGNKTFSHVSGVIAPGTGGHSGQTSRAVDGTGWIPVPLNQLAGGSTLAAWPVDPNPSASTGDFYYAYLCRNSDLTFTLFAHMESAYYKRNGPGDVESTDGGNLPGVYEVGTVFGLASSTGANFYPGL